MTKKKEKRHNLLTSDMRRHQYWSYRIKGIKKNIMKNLRSTYNLDQENKFWGRPKIPEQEKVENMKRPITSKYT